MGTHAPSAALELPRRRAPSLTRLCNVPGCERPARRRGRKCNACSLRAWRTTHREADRAREGKRTFTDEQQLLRNARATIAMGIKRGSLSAQACQECKGHGLPHHPDPRQKLEVVWLCREHRSLQRERETHARQQLALTQTAAVRSSALENVRAVFPPNGINSVQKFKRPSKPTRNPCLSAAWHLRDRHWPNKASFTLSEPGSNRKHDFSPRRIVYDRRSP